MKSSRFHGTNPSQSRRLTGAKATEAIPYADVCDCFTLRARNDNIFIYELSSSDYIPSLNG